eukprot:gene9838-7723_t
MAPVSLEDQASRQKHSAMYAQDKPALIAHLMLIALAIAPLIIHVPTSMNVIAMASLAVYCGCWRSVKPVLPEESMSKAEAMKFPLIGSCVLLGLFLCFRFLPKELVNFMLATYLGLIAIIVLTSAITPYFVEYFPEDLRKKEFHAPTFKIPHVIDTAESPIAVTLPELCIGVIASGFCAWYFVTKHWLANNVLGIAFSLEGIEHLSLGSVHVGVILLCGLFFYDIFWVFCTPVMVSVAKNFDAPIKLLFPRLIELNEAGVPGKRPFSMLGLGDIVIPGIFVALILRYDVQHGFTSKYFQTAFGGYVLGLGTTIFIMNTFNAAQPALLYIVPCVLGCTFIHAWAAGEFKSLFDFTEAKEDREVAPVEAVEGSEAKPVEEKKDK